MKEYFSFIFYSESKGEGERIHTDTSNVKDNVRESLAVIDFKGESSFQDRFQHCSGQISNCAALFIDNNGQVSIVHAIVVPHHVPFSTAFLN